MSAGHLIVCVGRRASDPLIAAQAAYLVRLQAMVPARLVRVRPSDSLREGRALLAQLPAAAHLTVLDPAGTAHTTLSFAAWLGRLWASSRPLGWVVGGADGLNAAVLDRAQARWSLSTLTLPHRLAQTLLTEQLYRAHTLLAGRPYHHGEGLAGRPAPAR